MSERREEFAAAVRGLLQRHGISQNMASIRADVDRFTVSRMVAGIPPRLDIIEKWARGFGEDINAWRVLAGYEPVWSAEEAFVSGLRELAAGYDLPAQFSIEEVPLTGATKEEVAEALAHVRERFDEAQRAR